MRSLVLLTILTMACRSDKADTTDTGKVQTVDADGDGYAEADDCDDHDPDVWPGADERCNGVDDDCDGEIDEDVQGTWYADADGDGWGDADAPIESCDPEDGYVPATDGIFDCDDTDPKVNPDGIELCNGVDDDCDGEVDEDATDAVAWYADADGDGYGDAADPTLACEVLPDTVADDTDCDDTDALIHPDAAETCDGVDQDCDGEIDEDATDATTWYIDWDGDGYGSEDYTEQRCESPEGYVDNADDCAPTEADAWPGATEVCDEIDNDCDGDVDEDVQSTWYTDADGDGYGDPDSATLACEAPSGTVADDTDCDDTDATLATACDVLGDGGDGSLSVSDDTNLNTDASGSRSWPDGVAWQVTATPSGTTLTVESTDGFAAGDAVLIADLQGSSSTVGAWELAEVASVSTGTLTLTDTLTGTYGSASDDTIIAQRVPQYEDLTVTGTLTASAFDGLDSGASTGRATGIVAFRVHGTLTLDAGGEITASGLGYPGGTDGGGPDGPWGETLSGCTDGTDGAWADGGAGAGTAGTVAGGDGGSSCSNSGGAGGLGGGGGGGKITHCAGGVPVTGGGGGGGAAACDAELNYSDDDFSTLYLGGGASTGAGGGESGYTGGGGADLAAGGLYTDGGDAENGGGAVLIWAYTASLQGTITVDGGDGGLGADGDPTDGYGSDDGGGGGGEGGQGGSGGTLMLSVLTLTADADTVSAWGGSGGDGGAGGDGFSGGVGGMGGTGATADGSPTSGAAGTYAGDGGAAGGGGAGGEAGDAGVVLVRAATVNGYSYGDADADTALDDITDGLLTTFEELAP